MTMPAEARRRPRPGESSTLAQTVDIETPELVTFSYTIAGIGSRVAAALVDYFLCLLILILMFVGLGSLGVGRFVSSGGTASEAWALAIMVLGQFLILWGYYVLWEGLADGQTPGKRIMRLRVVSDGGYSVTFAGSAIRNLVRILDMQPVVTYGFGITSIVATKQGKRLGDLAAGTIVVRERIVHQPAVHAHKPDTIVIGPQGQPEERTVAVRLTDDEFAVLEQFMNRRSSFDPARRVELASRLIKRYESAL